MRVTLPFDRQCQLAGLPTPIAEYAFAQDTEGRRWRVDWCFVRHHVAVEVEGGSFVGGRHTRGAGFRNDMEKYNSLACHGFRLLRVLPEQIANGQALTWCDRILRGSK